MLEGVSTGRGICKELSHVPSSSSYILWQGGFEETYCVQVAVPGEITGITFESGSNRLATCNRNSVIQVFMIGPKMDLHHIYSVVISDHVPKAIAFAQMGGDYKDLMTFGLYDGLM